MNPAVIRIEEKIAEHEKSIADLRLKLRTYRASCKHEKVYDIYDGDIFWTCRKCREEGHG